MVEPELVYYFGELEIKSCPKHVESKILMNKYWNQLNTIGHKQSKAIDEIDDNELLAKKLLGSSDKYDKIDKEFQGGMRGLNRCCYKTT